MHVYLLAVDESPEAVAAARWLGEFCRGEADARVVALYVFDPKAYYGEARRWGEPVQPLDLAMATAAREVMDRIVPALGLEADRVATLARIGVPEAVILDVARSEQASAIVLGNRPRSGLERLFHAALAERVERSAPCPVVAVAAPLAA